MKALILSAGKSSRLKPISDKNLLNFCGKTLLEHRLDSLKNLNLKKIIISTNKENKKEIIKITKKYKNISIVEQKDLSQGQAGGVLAAEKEIKNSPLLILSGNDTVEEDVPKKIIEKSKNLDGLILGLKVKEYFPGGYIKLNKEKITEIIEKPGEGNTPSDFVNVVVHFFKQPQELLKILKKHLNKKEGGYEDALTEFITNKKVNIFKYNGFWQPVKFPWNILDLNKFFLSQIKGNKISKKAKIHKTAVIENSVISDHTEVKEYAVIRNSFIGKNSLVANFSLVRDSNVGEKCVIGSFTEVARSFLSKNVWTHSNYLGDSVIDENVSFGAGTVTANLRLDEEKISVKVKNKLLSTNKNKLGIFCGKNVRSGIGVYFNPGVKIGENSFINSGLKISSDISKNKFLKNKEEIVENKFLEIKTRS